MAHLLNALWWSSACLAGLLLLASSCQSGKPQQDQIPSCSGDSPTLQPFSDAPETEPFSGEVVKYRLSGHCLYLKIKTRKRADRQDVWLLWNRRVKKSLPPQADVELRLKKGLGEKNKPQMFWVVFRLQPLNEYADPAKGLVLRIKPKVPALTYQPGKASPK